MQVVVESEQLQVEGSFILWVATEGLAIGELCGYRGIDRAFPPPISPRRRRGRNSVAQRLLNLDRPAIAADCRKIRSEHSAVTAHHVAGGASAFSKKEMLAGLRIARDGPPGHSGAEGRPPGHHEGCQCVGFYRRELNRGHSSIGNAFNDHVTNGCLGRSTRPGEFENIRAMATAETVLSVAADATRLIELFAA